MKFPKSMHPEGFYSHIDTTPGDPLLQRPKANAMPHGAPPAQARPRQREPQLAQGAIPRAAGAVPPHGPVAATPVSSSSTAWLLGAGAGVVLIAAAVAMSRNTAPVAPSGVLSPVVGQVAPASLQDTQLQAEPPAAGPVAAVPETPPAAAQTQPAAPVQPPALPPVAAAEPAPAQTPAKAAPEVERPRPEMVARASPQPSIKTLTPSPETLAQTAPAAPVLLPQPAAAPDTVAQPTAVPVVPPVAQAQPAPTAPAADPEDTGITVKVRMALSIDAVLAAVPIAVSTDHGVVKLEGQAPDAQARERATVVASSAAGVKAVDNRLTLPPVATLGVSQGG